MNTKVLFIAEDITNFKSAIEKYFNIRIKEMRYDRVHSCTVVGL